MPRLLALLLLAELGSFGQQAWRNSPQPQRAAAAAGGFWRRRCGATSPLKIQTLTPMVPYLVLGGGAGRTRCRRAACAAERDLRGSVSTRAISLPPRRPEQRMRMPLAPNFIAVRQRLLHRAAEGDAALELGRDVLGDELRVGLRLADLLDVDEDLVLGELLELFLELLHAGAALADDHAGARGVDDDLGLVRGALDRRCPRCSRWRTSSRRACAAHVLVEPLA